MSIPADELKSSTMEAIEDKQAREQHGLTMEESRTIRERNEEKAVKREAANPYHHRTRSSEKAA